MLLSSASSSSPYDDDDDHTLQVGNEIIHDFVNADNLPVVSFGGAPTQRQRIRIPGLFQIVVEMVKLPKKIQEDLRQLNISPKLLNVIKAGQMLD